MKVKYTYTITTIRNNKTWYLQDRRQFGKDLWTPKKDFAMIFKDYESASDLFRKYRLDPKEYEITSLLVK